jgi:hypothetical protein
MTVIIDGTSGITYPSNTTQNTAYQTRFKNRFINGGMTIAQRANSATVTSGTSVPTSSTGYPAVDRWFVYSTGANVTAAQVAGSNNTQNVMQITGAASVTVIGVGQRIENNNSYDLAGQTVTLSVNISNSLLTNVTWEASYANTSNTFGTIGTPTKTQISTGTFTVNSTITQYSTQISIPSNATTGVEILFTVGAQTSGTWVIGNAQLEVGSSASAFEYVDQTTQLCMCQRYYESETGTAFSTAANGGFGNSYLGSYYFKVQKRTSPTITIFSGGGLTGTAGSATWYPGSTVATATLTATSASLFSMQQSGTSTYNLASYSLIASSEL